MRAIQFETVVDSGVIRIPERYVRFVSSTVSVTIAPTEKPRLKFKPRTKTEELGIDDFTPFIDTGFVKFDRDEANERG